MTEHLIAPYHKETAPGHLIELKEKAVAQLGAAFREKACTQTELAQALGVTQPRLSDALRGKYEKFTLDRLFEMLFSLGKSVELNFDPSPVGASVKTRSKQDNEELVEHYTALVDEDPTDATSFARRAWAQIQLGNLDRAVADWSRAAELEPDRPGPRANRIIAYRKLGQLKTALFECDRLEEDFPGYGVSSHRGMILAEMGRTAEALQAYNEDVAQRPDRPGPYTNRGDLLQKLGRLDEALADYEQACRTDPTCERYPAKIEELRMELGTSN